MLRTGADSATPVQPSAAPEPGIGAKCISITSGPRSKDSRRYSGALPTERPRKPVSFYRYELFYEMARSLRHPQSRGFDIG
jgi:hypothetical protein